jgi:thioredoxin-like negative regulator of GroEL
MTRSTRGTLLFAALLALAFAGLATADHHEAKPMIVKIHADWCGTCQKLNATMAELESQVGSQATLVVLDVTDREAVERSTAEADRLGIRSFFDQYKGSTGTVAVLTASGEPVSVMKGELDADKYVAALAEAS